MTAHAKHPPHARPGEKHTTETSERIRPALDWKPVAMAEGFASAGAHVILVGRDPAKADARLAKIKAAGADTEHEAALRDVIHEGHAMREFRRMVVGQDLRARRELDARRPHERLRDEDVGRGARGHGSSARAQEPQLQRIASGRWPQGRAHRCAAQRRMGADAHDRAHARRARVRSTRRARTTAMRADRSDRRRGAPAAARPHETACLSPGSRHRYTMDPET